ncbi:MAG TPA: hypothetical protein PL059_07420 [Spirochaetota bacterium]|nr:hypothetical protein [Spirochaetota bacterium]HOM09662.1 hypothetical protein [Spirochaetota bacterium]HPP50432.1 hypothetical protein [Spirochaetota bacterium]
MSTPIVEEKTPKGYTLKINIAKKQYIAFNPKGEIIYSDDNKTKPFHIMKTIVFIGLEPVTSTRNHPYQLLKIQNNALIISYNAGEGKRQYLFFPSDTLLDMVPCITEFFNDTASFVSYVKKGNVPDYIIVNSTFSNNDITFISSISPSSRLEIVNTTSAVTIDDTKRAIDQMNNVDINLLSQNPVFLARIHLRNLDLVRVKQIILDMDITESDAQYIIAFLSTMIKNSDKEELQKHVEKLKELKKTYEFYFHLITHNDEKIQEFITQASKNDLITFQTLIQKAKLLFPTKEASLRFVEYENLIWEKQQ